jgi:hypothetical protein
MVGYGCQRDQTRNDYEASGLFALRTEGPERERRFGEELLPGIRGRWRQGEEILNEEGELGEGKATPNVSISPLGQLFTPQRARGSKRSLTTPDLYRHLTPAHPYLYPVTPRLPLVLVPRKRILH